MYDIPRLKLEAKMAEARMQNHLETINCLQAILTDRWQKSSFHNLNDFIASNLETFLELQKEMHIFSLTCEDIRLANFIIENQSQT